jgi:GT2 family glycosyltransferase
LAPVKLSKPDNEVVAALVLSYNKREHTLRCLESIGRQTYQLPHVIVVDNNSTDGSADAIAGRFPQVQVVRSPRNLGAAGGRNLGIRWLNEHVPYTCLLFLDDDTVADEAMASELIAEMRRHSDAGMITPKGYRAGTSDLIASAGGMRVRLGLGSIRDIGAGERDDGQFAEPAVVDACVGFAVLARREALERSGCFDESYNPYGWEEVDLSLRVRQAGYTIRYAPRALCWHAGGTPGRGHRILAYERGKMVNYARLMARHASVGEWVSFVALSPIRAARLFSSQLRSLLRF